MKSCYLQSDDSKLYDREIFQSGRPSRSHGSSPRKGRMSIVIHEEILSALGIRKGNIFKGNKRSEEVRHRTLQKPNRGS